MRKYRRGDVAMDLHHGHVRPTDCRGLVVHLRRVGLIVALSLVAAIPLAPAALATVPGPNGLIAFRADKGTGDQIYTIEPDGTGQTNSPSSTGTTSCSPTGRRTAG